MQEMHTGLRAQVEQMSRDVERSEIMTKDEIIHFVMHYERLTRYVLEEIPKFADIVIYRNEKFNFNII